MTSLLIAPGERFDVIVDFTGIPLGSTVMMTNDANAPYPDGDPAIVTELMKININTAVPANDPDNTVLPANLKLPAVPRLVPTPGLPPRDVVAKENMVRGRDEESDRGAAQRLPLHGPNYGLHQGRHYRNLAVDQPDC